MKSKKEKLKPISDEQLDVLIKHCKTRTKRKLDPEFGTAVMYLDPAFVLKLAIEIRKGRRHEHK